MEDKICVCGHAADEHLNSDGKCQVDECPCDTFVEDVAVPDMADEQGQA